MTGSFPTVILRHHDHTDQGGSNDDTINRVARRPGRTVLEDPQALSGLAARIDAQFA